MQFNQKQTQKKQKPKKQLKSKKKQPKIIKQTENLQKYLNFRFLDLQIYSELCFFQNELEHSKLYNVIDSKFLSKQYQKQPNKVKLFNQSLIYFGPFFHKPFSYDSNLNIEINSETIKISAEAQEQLLNLVYFVTFQKQSLNLKDYDRKKIRHLKNFYETTQMKQIFEKFEDFLEINLQKYALYIQQGKYNKNFQFHHYHQLDKYTEQEKQLIQQDQCIIDGNVYKIMNNKILFGIYVGQENNENAGYYRQGCEPEEVIINTTSKIHLIPGKKFKEIISNNQSQFLMSWFDQASKKVIYARPERSSEVRTQSKIKSYLLAQEAATSQNQQKILQLIQQLIQDQNPDTSFKNMQLGIVIFLIYKFGIRQGAHDLENGVVGVTQLQKKHIEIFQQKDKFFIKLDFIGKDQVRYNHTKRLPKLIYQALQSLLQTKKNIDVNQKIFDIGYQQVNLKLSSIIPGLSAHTFRTMRASIIIDQKLQETKQNYPKDFDKKYLITILKNALFEVAEFCNHMKKNKNITKAKIQQEQDKKRQKINKIQEDIDNIQKQIENKSGKEKEQLQKQLEILTFRKKFLLQKFDQLTKNFIYSTGTSKKEYIFPMIIFSFLNYYQIPHNKIFSESELKQFAWARNAPENFKFYDGNKEIEYKNLDEDLVEVLENNSSLSESKQSKKSKSFSFNFDNFDNNHSNLQIQFENLIYHSNNQNYSDFTLEFIEQESDF